MKDSEAKLFDYPFDNEDILTECQNIVNYVPYPVVYMDLLINIVLIFI